MSDLIKYFFLQKKRPKLKRKHKETKKYNELF